jgi:hypothetical protein
MLTLKADVQLALCEPQIVLADAIVQSIYAGKYGLQCQITSGTEGTHVVGSLHYKGLAHDYGVLTVPPGVLVALVGDLVAALPGYVVLYEGPIQPPGLPSQHYLRSDAPHLHVQFSPTYPVHEEAPVL